MAERRKLADTIVRAGDQWLERTSNDGGEYPDCPDCGGPWNPMWPPTLQRRHPADCPFIKDITEGLL